MARKDGYVGDIEYVFLFTCEMGPSALNFVLTMQGMEPIPLSHGFSWCDLGCGQGMSTNVFAACHPEGQFHAIDFNRAHIQGARELASQASLPNASFWEATFEDLGQLDLPEFDFITLHGVYSWINADNRKRIVDFIRRKLKPGGVVYVSYNCLPGWAPLAPIRQLLITCADMESECIEEQINASVEFVGKLKSMNLSYFSVNPSANGFFDALSKLSRNYLAHEYFNKDWVQFYHADVVKDFAAAHLNFIGSAKIVDNLDFLSFSPEEQRLLNSIEDSTLKETIKDFAANTKFRRDVFTKSRKRAAQINYQEMIAQCCFGLVVPRADVVMTAKLPRCDVHFVEEIFQPVLYALDERHQSLEELLRKPGIAGFSAEKVYQTLMILLSMGAIMPAVEPTQQAIVSTRLFNYAILERMALNFEPQHLASPVVQNGIQLDWVQRLLLLCELTESGNPLSFVSSMMLQQNCALIKDGAALQTWDENIEELTRQVQSFYTLTLPLLKRLAVV